MTIYKQIAGRGGFSDILARFKPFWIKNKPKCQGDFGYSRRTVGLRFVMKNLDCKYCIQRSRPAKTGRLWDKAHTQLIQTFGIYRLHSFPNNFGLMWLGSFNLISNDFRFRIVYNNPVGFTEIAFREPIGE